MPAWQEKLQLSMLQSHWCRSMPIAEEGNQPGMLSVGLNHDGSYLSLHVRSDTTWTPTRA